MDIRGYRLRVSPEMNVEKSEKDALDESSSWWREKYPELVERVKDPKRIWPTHRLVMNEDELQYLSGLRLRHTQVVEARRYFDEFMKGK